MPPGGWRVWPGLHGAVYLGFLGVSLTFFDALHPATRSGAVAALPGGMLMACRPACPARRPRKKGRGVRIARADWPWHCWSCPYSVATMGRLQESSGRAGVCQSGLAQLRDGGPDPPTRDAIYSCFRTRRSRSIS